MAGMRFQFKPYRRPLARTVRTAHGVWRAREGLVVRLEGPEGRAGFGEVAPLEGFHTETAAGATAFLERLGERVEGPVWKRVPEALPCCQMALWAAEQMAAGEGPLEREFEVAGLLPAGEAALEEMERLLGEGYHTFKWKIGVGRVEEEIGLFNKLVEELPPHGRLRLDANGGLTRKALEQWLPRLAEARSFGFLEQPMGPGHQGMMAELGKQFGVVLALDESVSQLNSLLGALISGWNGLLVVKPSIVGSPLQYLQWQMAWERPLLFSSAFETGIGMEAALQIAAAAPVPERVLPLGFGTQAYFGEDGLTLHPPGPKIRAGKAGATEMEALWNRL